MRGLRKPVIAANWKMNKTIGEARALAAGVAASAGSKPVDVIVCPPFTALAPVAEELAGSPVQLGAQDVYWRPQGAYTGEVAPGMLTDVGCRAVIIGHSERRLLLGETDEAVARKVAASLGAGLTPIVCVGEDFTEREAGETEAKVAFQVNAATGWLLSPEQVARLVIAYEPIWAIGTGNSADGDTAQQVCRHIRETVAARFGEAVAQQVRILYGGSVNAGNVGQFARQPDVDGALVGGASLAADAFAAIVDAWSDATKEQAG